MVRSHHPTYFQTYLGDPLGVLIIDRLSLSPVQFALIALGAALIVDAISYTLVGKKVLALSGWTDVWAYVVYLYVIFPVIVSAYIWVARATSDVFHGLRQSEALVAPEEEYDHFIHHSLQRLYSHRGWTIASLAIVVLVAVYYAIIFAWGWPLLPLVLRVLKVVVLYVPGWYVVCQIVAREIVTIWGLRQVFRCFKVRPHPLHPDRCGGLRAINNYAVGFTYIIATAGIGVGLMAYTSLRRDGVLSPDMAILIAIYVIVALICFFLPPLTAHAAMDRAKRELLADISRQFQQDYAEATARLASTTDELDTHVSKVQDLRTLYEMTDAFPVWPLDTATLRRFAVTITAPLMPAIVELAIGIGSALLRSK